MPYTPPNGNAVNVDFAEEGAFTPPAGNAVNVDFAESGSGFTAGNANITEAADTIAADGSVSRVGDLNSTEVADTLSADGVLTPISVGDANVTEQADTATADGVLVPISFGTASVTEAADTTTADGSALVQGTFNKNEAANTLSATGFLNFNVQLSLLATNGALTFQRKTFNGSPNGPVVSAPYVYVDSGSGFGTLSAFPLSTGVSLGDKYLYSADALHHFLYWECTQAGTTGGSHITATAYDMGVEKTSNTAKFKVRRHQGWARARTAVVADLLNQNPLASSSFVLTTEWTMFLASSHSQTFAANVNFLMAEKLNFSGGNAPGHTMISVDKSVAVPVTMTAGAALLGTGDAKGILIRSDTQDEGLVRGVKLGHDNTASTASGRYDIFDPPTDVRMYDCTFQTYRQNNAYDAGYNETEYGIGATARHDVRSTYASLHASNPAPAMGPHPSSNRFVEAPTISRLTSASTPVIRAATIPYGDWPDGDLVLLAADLSSFTGGPAYVGEHGTAAVMKEGSAFRTLGVHMASGALTLPAVPPMDLAFSTMGSTAVGEFRWGDDYLITRGMYQDGYLSHEPLVTYPSTTREATVVRTGGASDALGNFSHKTEVQKRWHYPYKFEFFNEKIDESFLITLHFIWSSTGSGLTLLRDEDVWLEAAFLNHATKNSAELVFSFDKYNRRGLIFNDPVGPPTLATSSETWGGSVSGAVKQKVSVIVTPKKVGPVKVWVGLWLCPYTWNLASVDSVPIYICPRPVLSAAP